MNVTKAVEIAAVMLAPTAAVGALVWGPRGLGRLRRLQLERRARRHPLASRPPIEVDAARLRRMLEHRAALLRSPGTAGHTHLVALDRAIADTASELADAVGVERPQLRASEVLSESDLHALLARLVEAGVVLPPMRLCS